MNTSKIAKGLALGASLFLASAAFAGEKATVKVYEEVKVNGKTLPAGSYDLTWEGSGANVQVTVHQGKETITTVAGQIEESKTAPASTGYSTRKEGDGSKSITTVFFAGKKYSLNLDQQSAAAQAAAATAGNK
jgi:hypothetical protein